jgi:hypothetical protein
LQHACSKNADRIIADTRTTAQINDDWQTSFFYLVHPKETHEIIQFGKQSGHRDRR